MPIFPDDPEELRLDDLSRLVRSLHPNVEVVDFEVIENKTFVPAHLIRLVNGAEVLEGGSLAGNGVEAIRANMKAIGEACKGCHQPFRAPKN